MNFMRSPERFIDKLIEYEAGVHYNETAQEDQTPFVVIDRNSSILISAPHGAVTYRNRHNERWHEEDEFTAGMAFLLGELCRTSVIATVWKTIDSDPNFHDEINSPYKKQIRSMLSRYKIKYVIDLHGAKRDSERMPADALVDIGTGNRKTISTEIIETLRDMLEGHLGDRAVSFDSYPAKTENNSITAFCFRDLQLSSIQIEMKPQVRVARRRSDSSLFERAQPFGGAYEAEPEKIIAMFQSMISFINYLRKDI